MQKIKTLGSYILTILLKIVCFIGGISFPLSIVSVLSSSGFNSEEYFGMYIAGLLFLPILILTELLLIALLFVISEKKPNKKEIIFLTLPTVSLFLFILMGGLLDSGYFR